MWSLSPCAHWGPGVRVSSGLCAQAKVTRETAGRCQIGAPFPQGRSLQVLPACSQFCSPGALPALKASADPKLVTQPVLAAVEDFRASHGAFPPGQLDSVKLKHETAALCVGIVLAVL